MARCYPQLIERFPAYRERALRCRFTDAAIDELCRDYERVVNAIGTQEEESGSGMATREEHRQLRGLARELEQEFLERIRSCGNQRDNNNTRTRAVGRRRR